MTNKALARYAVRRTAALARLAEIEAALAAPVERPDWGDVGSMAHIDELLTEVARFAGGAS